METFGFRQSFHWPFLVVWALFLPPILLWGWRFAAGTAMLALLVWHLVINERFLSFFAGGFGGVSYLTAELSLLAAVGFLLVGVMMEWHPRFSPLAVIVQRFAIIGALVDLQVLTHFRGFLHVRGRAPVAADTEWTVGILIALALLAPLAALVMRQAQGRLAPGVVRSGMALFAVLGALIVTSLLIGPFGAARTALGIGFNLFYYASLLWLIYAGYQRGDPFRVNTGFVFFVLGIAYLYFDTFWTLMDRSFSFVVGGLLLCGGGYLIERQRLLLLARLDRPALGGEGA
jgi:uncharacterized membrane protein